MSDTKYKPKSLFTKVFYYGLALDSIGNSVRRTKSYAGTFKKGFVGLLAILKSEPTYEVAQTHDDLYQTQVASAHKLIIYSFFALVFLAFAFFKSGDIWPTIVNCAISLTFVLQMFIHLLVYIRAKEAISHLPIAETQKDNQDE